MDKHCLKRCYLCSACTKEKIRSDRGGRRWWCLGGLRLEFSAQAFIVVFRAWRGNAFDRVVGFVFNVNVVGGIFIEGVFVSCFFCVYGCFGFDFLFD